MLGLAVLFIPTYWRLGSTIWVTDEQGHGPIILGLALWYIAQQRSLIHALVPNPRKALGIGFFSLGLLAYCLGRSQDILLLEVGAQIPVVMGLLLLARGWAAVKILWFPLFFLIFMVPLPGGLGVAEFSFGGLYEIIRPGGGKVIGLTGRLALRVIEWTLGGICYIVYLTMKAELPGTPSKEQVKAAAELEHLAPGEEPE